MTVTIRPMQEADLPKVLQIEQDVHIHPWTDALFRDSFFNNRDQVDKRATHDKQYIVGVDNSFFFFACFSLIYTQLY